MIEAKEKEILKDIENQESNQKEENPYHFEDFIYEKGLFDKCIDATYIIFLEGNEERKSNIKNQLEKYKPSKKVHILNNKGFKKCKKNLKEQLPRYDLIDCFIEVFKDSQKRGYNNILVLEDDFEFSEKINEEPITDSINNFVNTCSERNINFIYLLGCVPYLQCLTLFWNHRKLLLSTGTHACIYSKKFIENTLNTDQNNIYDWDLYTNFNYGFTNRYIYKEPLCYQLFYETENFNSWPDVFNFKYIVMKIFKYLNMNKFAEPGFSYFYSFSFYMFYITEIIISIIIIHIIRSIIK